MKYTVEELSQVQRKLKVEVPLEDVQKVRQGVLKKTQRTAKFKGFRPGKAPLSLVESNYGPQVTMDTVEEVINQYYPQAILQSGHNPINQPKFDVESMDMDKDFVFSAEFEVRPQFELDSAQYLGLELTEPALDVSESSVEDTIKHLLEHHAKFVEIDDVRPAEQGDVVVVDYQTFEGETALEDKVENADLELSPGVLLAPIAEALAGAEPGQSVEAFVDFDENVDNPALKGKHVRFVFSVKGLKKKELPEFGDEFVKATWPDMENAEQFRARVKEDLEQRFNQQREQNLRQQVVDKLDDMSEFEVPESLVKAEQEAMVNKFKQYIQGQGVDSLPGFNDDVLMEEVRENATKKVKAGIVLGRIAELEKVDVEQGDIEKELEKQAQGMQGMPASAVREFYTKNNMMQTLVGRILEDKTLQHLIAAAKITQAEKSQENPA